MAWQYMVHAELGAHQLAPADAVDVWQGRGWERRAMPEGIDPNDPNAPWDLAELPVTDTEVVLDPGEVEALKGKSLNEALEAAGLSKAGTVDEKRARLAEHEKELTNTDPEESE